MYIKPNTLALFFSSLSLLAACHAPSKTADPLIFKYFRAAAPGDTLHIEIAFDAPTQGDTIPNALFFKTIPAALLQEIDYLVDSSANVLLGRQRFSLNDSITACWVDLQYSWFQHQSLFLYNIKSQRFTDRVTVAEWYGGDGGQLLTGSWVFDYDGDGPKDIVRREIQHSMMMQADTVLERNEQAATLLLWKNGRFMETPMKDTAAVIKRYPIKGVWE
jgi:hypothetical protein